MSPFTLTLHKPYFGRYARFSLIHIGADWGGSDFTTDLQGWGSLHVSILSFGFTLTYWPQPKEPS